MQQRALQRRFSKGLSQLNGCLFAEAKAEATMKRALLSSATPTTPAEEGCKEKPAEDRLNAFKLLPTRVQV